MWSFDGRGEREQVLGLLSLTCSRCSVFKSSYLTLAGHGVCRNLWYGAICRDFKADETAVTMTKWEKSIQKSSWSLVFLIYESTRDEKLLSSAIGPEHAELMELRDVSGSISLVHERCCTSPCPRCCSLLGAARDPSVFRRNSGVLAKTTYCGSSRGSNGNTREKLVTVSAKLQQGYIDRWYMLKDSVNEYF